MPILAKQDQNYDYTVKQVAVPHPETGNKSGYFMNIRTDNDEILGWTSDRYGLVNNADLLDKADGAFEARGIDVTRKVIVTEGGAKMRAQYDLSGDMFRAEVRKWATRWRTASRLKTRLTVPSASRLRWAWFASSAPMAW